MWVLEQNNQKNKKIGACFLTRNTLGVKRHVGIPRWDQDEPTNENQDEINLHNEENKQLMQVQWKWCYKFSKDNLKHKFYMARNF